MHAKQILIPQGPGTYMLVLYLSDHRTIEIGKLGRLPFLSGWYGYVGSAMGPGGVASRMKRHLKVHKSKHWHIDYLRSACRVTGVTVGMGKEVKEHQWASRLARAPFGGEPIHGFGSSDCRCKTHLYYFSARPDPALLAHHLEAQSIPWQIPS